LVSQVVCGDGILRQRHRVCKNLLPLCDLLDSVSGLGWIEHDASELSMGGRSFRQECENCGGKPEAFHIWQSFMATLVTLSASDYRCKQLRLVFVRIDGIGVLFTFPAYLDRSA
jgi:hypothetical protein